MQLLIPVWDTYFWHQSPHLCFTLVIKSAMQPGYNLNNFCLSYGMDKLLNVIIILWMRFIIHALNSMRVYLFYQRGPWRVLKLIALLLALMHNKLPCCGERVLLVHTTKWLHICFLYYIIWMINSMASFLPNVMSPLLIHWRYHSFALNQWYQYHLISIQNRRATITSKTSL